MDIASITVRKIGYSDVENLIFHRHAYLREMQGERDELYLEKLSNDLRVFFNEGLKMNTFFGLVAEYNGEQVAFGGMIIRTIPGDFNSTSYSEADVLNMYTLPDFRRKGISRLVLRGLIDEARRMNISKLALHTTTSGEKLYRSLGFDNPSYPYLELKL